MGKKIFVTYKYSDSLVQGLDGNYFSTARDYVDKLQDLLDDEDYIYKGENDNESLEDFKDETIETKLKNKIFDSTMTIVLISKGMKDYSRPETDQWIPWEISYSLKEMTRAGRTSKTNAVLAVVLPDENGSYEYYFTYNPNCNSTTFHTDRLFKILRDNMFNIKNPDTRQCEGSTIYNGYFSYIFCVKWNDFKEDIDKYIGIAFHIKENAKDYNISKSVD